MKEKRALRKTKSFRSVLDEEIGKLRLKYETIPTENDAIESFHEFPLSQNTLKGLNAAKYIQPTDIQRNSIGPALLGKDVLAAAITGSGKTLAFLIPVLEHLYIAKWSRADGVGAIIISPTRELAYQIFETIKIIGKYHDFSVGLIIGGKNLKFERSRMDQCNILICTPGRLLQHMDENPLFNASTMEMLILDEADRCLDMGFEQTLNSIVENIPPNRQTLLFSATQTSSVKDLARLNLKDPVYIGHSKNILEAQNVGKVPDSLQQNYVVVELEDKITMLYSFIKNHLKLKIIVFLSSCKQAKYIYEIFCKLRPGTSLLALYGTLHQDRRISIYNDFVKKSNVVLFATDIASRGLDFPSVSWVVQLDCPEDVNQYIHRAGRSARNKKRGENLLVLLPSEEEGMIQELNRKCLAIQKIQIDPKKLFSPRAKIEAFLAQNQELKASAQRSFVAYIKSVFLMKNKNVFNVLALNFDAYAKSLGLAVTPRVRFLNRFLKKQSVANTKARIEVSHTGFGNISKDGDDERGKSRERNAPKHFSEFKKDYSLFEPLDNTDSDESVDDFIKIRRVNHAILNDDSKVDIIEDEELPHPILRVNPKCVTKAAMAKKVLKKKIQLNEKVKFDEDGQEIVDQRKQLQSKLAKEYQSNVLPTSGIDIDVVKQLLKEEDIFDKQRFRDLVKQRHKADKERLKTRDKNKDNEEDEIESEEDGSVDLSWLPKARTCNSEESDSSLESNNAETSYNSKRNLQAEDSDADDGNGKRVQEPFAKKPKITSKLTLKDTEVIAKQLLANYID